MSKNYNEYLERSFGRWLKENGRKRKTEKAYQLFGKERSNAIQKSLRRYYKQGKEINLSKLDPKLREALVGNIDFSGTIERQRTRKKIGRARKKFSKIESAITVTGVQYHFLNKGISSFVKALEKDQDFSGRFRWGEDFDEDAKLWNGSEFEDRTNYLDFMIMLKDDKGGDAKDKPLYDIKMLVRKDGLFDIGINIIEWYYETP